MAETDETFDPNDLDSIDALLDEAESDTAIDEAEQDTAINDGDGESADDTAPGSIDELLVEAEEVSGTEEADSPTDETRDASLAQSGREATKLKQDSSAKDDAVPDADDFLAKRAAAQSNNNSNMAAKDMDEIKKQILIFGAILIGLVLVGIGVGIWSVLAANSSAMDEETFTIIESNLVRSELNGKGIAESGNALKSLDQKIDALSFQLKGLVEEVSTIEELAQKQVSVMMPSVVDVGQKSGASLSDKNGAVKSNHAATAVVRMNYPASDPRLLDKVTTVNSKMIKAQKRIDEVNRRVKSLQQQYKTLLHSVKTVEKQLVMQQLALEEKEKAKEAKKNQYQYGSPDGMFYDQSVGDSYP